MLEKLSSGISETTAGPVNKPANKCSLRFLLPQWPVGKNLHPERIRNQANALFYQGRNQFGCEAPLTARGVGRRSGLPRLNGLTKMRAAQKKFPEIQADRIFQRPRQQKSLVKIILAGQLF